MPNCSSSSIDWAMSTEGCQPVKKRNLLENLQVPAETLSTPPKPPPFQDFLSLINTKKRPHTSLSTSAMSNENHRYLPHQTPSPLLDRTNYKYAKIRARPIYNFQYNRTSIWTQSSSNSNQLLLNHVPFDVNIVNKFFAQETKPINNDGNMQRSRSSSISNGITQTFQILDKSSQITYDVTMRHLLQLLTKNNNKSATIDDVLYGIDTGNIDTEWLQCVLRLNKTLNKQLEKRPEDRIKLETCNTEDLDQLHIVEQFFVKLLRLQNYDFKLKCYQYRDELQSQLVLLSQSVERLIRGIELVLHHEYLPGVCQLLCYLYNIVSNKSVPGLDLVSLIDALQSPTNRSNKTVAHVLTKILHEDYENYLINLVNNEELLELKKLASVRYEKLYQEIREIYQQYQQIEYQYSSIQNQNTLPSFISPLLLEAKLQFENLFQNEMKIRRGEQDLASYFCSNELSIDMCLSTIGQFVDKLRLAHDDNRKEQKRKPLATNSERNNSTLFSVKTKSSFLSCI